MKSLLWIMALWLSLPNMGLANEASPGEKAPVAILFPNELGPDSVDVSSYPVEMQRIYRTTLNRCTRCHSLSRPLNAQFIELNTDEIAQIKKDRPELFKDKGLFMADEDIWKRYVKRMMGM